MSELAIEKCKYCGRNLSGDEIYEKCACYKTNKVPLEIIRAAKKISVYMRVNGHNKWMLENICSRNHAIKLEEIRKILNDKQ